MMLRQVWLTKLLLKGSLLMPVLSHVIVVLLVDLLWCKVLLGLSLTSHGWRHQHLRLWDASLLVASECCCTSLAIRIAALILGTTMLLTSLVVPSPFFWHAWFTTVASSLEILVLLMVNRLLWLSLLSMRLKQLILLRLLMLLSSRRMVLTLIVLVHRPIVIWSVSSLVLMHGIEARTSKLLKTRLEAFLFIPEHWLLFMVSVTIGVQKERILRIRHQVNIKRPLDLSGFVLKTLYLVEECKITNLQKLTLFRVVDRCSYCGQVFKQFLINHILLLFFTPFFGKLSLNFQVLCLMKFVLLFNIDAALVAHLSLVLISLAV